MSKQTKNTHSVPSAASGLTHSATGQAPEHRTKYTYDKLGQVTSGKRVWQDGTPVAGQQYEYTFDDIGNRKSASMGGDASWGPLRQARYDNPNPPNRLNQYAQREVPAAVDILGIANPTEPVTVNGNTAYRKGEYFDYTLSTPNGTAPWDNTVTVHSDYGAGQTSSGSLFVPQTPEQFAYDADGNLTQDGRWNYTWDAENRLVELEPASSVSDAKLVFEYDASGRRIGKQIWNNAQESGGPDLDQRFLYDDWNLFVVLDYPYYLEWFVWGLDLSGSLQGAGGVGGLLMETTYLPATATSFAAYDGNGNVMALVNADDGSFSAQYQYGPFGELLRATGPVAKINPFRFSTKYQDDETDLIYYGYRYYSPTMGRWMSTDPLQEQGGINLYVAVANAPVNSYDFLGLAGPGECGHVVPSYLEGVTDKAKALDILRSKFPNDPTRIARELKMWEKYRGLRGSSVLRTTKKFMKGCAEQGAKRWAIILLILEEICDPPSCGATEDQILWQMRNGTNTVYGVGTPLLPPIQTKCTDREAHDCCPWRCGFWIDENTDTCIVQ